MIPFIFWLFIGMTSTLIFEKIILSNKRLKNEFWDNPKTVFGYHFHHSTLGLILLIIGIIIFLYGSTLGVSLAGFGLGIIIVHTYTDRELIFIEKSKHS